MSEAQDYIGELLAGWPPLTQQQLDDLAALFGEVAGGQSDAA